MGEFRSKLDKILNQRSIKTNEMMREHTTFRIGGPADYYVTPESVDQLSAVIRLCKEERMPYYVIGNGSNLLVSDKGFRGMMIAMTDSMGACKIERIEGDDSLMRVTAGAGIRLFCLAKRIEEASLTGFEFAAGIPGTLGGALVMNAGAYGSEMKDILVSARVLDVNGNMLSLTAEELELGYRTSCIAGRGYTALEGTFELKVGNPKLIREKREELSLKRRMKQPLEYPSAGSTFKRPDGYFAGVLIEEAGMKGVRTGGAQVSDKHAGFVINRDNATAADVRDLCREVAVRVKKNANVNLEMEVKILGEID